MTAFYLKELTIHNFATFKQQTIHFSPHYNAIIGETGTGKSLILDALEIILGERADKKFIRAGAKFATVEALFVSSHEEVEKFFTKIGFPYENGNIVVKRVIYHDRPTQSFLNFQQCTLQTLQHLSRKFIDFVGQFENQKLLQPEYQLHFLDHYGELIPEATNYRKNYLSWQETKKQLDEIERSINEEAQKRDYLLFQLQELTEIAPSVEEEEKLLKQKKEFQVHEKRQQLLAQIIDPLTESEVVPIIPSLKKISFLVRKNEDCFSAELSKSLEMGISLIEEFSYQISKSVSEQEMEISIEDIVHRLSLYQKLKNKYRKDIPQILDMKKGWEDELNSFESHSERKQELTDQWEKEFKALTKEAEELYLKRFMAAQKLSQKLTEVVQHLNMQGAQIKIDLTKQEELNAHGGVYIDFLAQTNPGEGLYPFKTIASGGELSRLLLSCRQLISNKELITIFLFDEIDAGIGGATALTVGKSLKKMSEHSQLLVITHLPQMAHYSDQIILVSKNSSLNSEEQDLRTESLVQEITGKDKQAVIRQMVPLE